MPPSVGSVETTNSGFRPFSLCRYCQHRPSQSSSCTVAVTTRVYSPLEFQVLDDLARVDHRGHAAFLVAGAAPADASRRPRSLRRGRTSQLSRIADADRVDMGVHRDQARARWPMVPMTIAHRVDLDRVEADLLHLFLDALDDFGPSVAAFAGDADHVAQEAGHVGLVGSRPARGCRRRGSKRS